MAISLGHPDFAGDNGFAAGKVNRAEMGGNAVGNSRSFFFSDGQGDAQRAGGLCAPTAEGNLVEGSLRAGGGPARTTGFDGPEKTGANHPSGGGDGIHRG